MSLSGFDSSSTESNPEIYLKTKKIKIFTLFKFFTLSLRDIRIYANTDVTLDHWLLQTVA